jgi:2-oxo-3-hexenedioate decarboxylase
MNKERIKELAGIVDDAAANAREIGMLTADEADLSIAEAYLIQRQSVQRRLKRGERLVGMKMGLTSRAKMEQVGVNEPIYGHLTSTMIVLDGGTVDLAGLCHPRVEPEIAFIIGEDLRGPITTVQALDAVAGVCAALEVIDSRYKDFKFKLPDVIADNTSASKFVLGSRLVAAHEVNLGNLGIILEINGRAKELGSSAAVLEHPIRSLATLVNMLAEVDEDLKKGSIVLSGGATAAVPLNAGDHVRAIVDEVGTAEMRVIGTH